MDGKIIIKPYQQYWHTEFLNEKNKIVPLLHEEIIAIEHIGSTAVEGLGAKPLIDMMIGVTNLQITENWTEKLTEIGYEYVPKETPNWRFLGRVNGESGTHHLHVYIYNSEEWRNNLLFRDFLINHEWAREEYRKLKEMLAATYPFDRVSYTNAKAPFIQNILTVAKKSINKV